MRSVLIASVLIAVTACGEIDLRKPRTPDPGPPPEAEVSGPPGRVASTLKIPPGHLPPVGQCRIWKPGAPPGKQTKAGACETLAARVPPGAWLIARRASAPGRVLVDVYDPQRVGVVVQRQSFDAASGDLIEQTQLDQNQ